MNIVIREKVQVPAVQPVPWKREVNMPPAEWFRGEWLPARIQKEHQALVKKDDTMQKWLYFFKWMGIGILFLGGSMAGLLGMLLLVGTP